MMNGLLALGNISYSSASFGAQMRHHVLRAADVNDTGILKKHMQQGMRKATIIR